MMRVLEHQLAKLRAQGLRSLLFELLRFGGVGALTTLLYFGLVWLFAKLVPSPMWLVAALASGPPLVVGYLLHRSVTFNSQQQHKRAMTRFVLVQLVGVVINSAVIALAADLLGFPFWFAQLAAMGVQIAATYLGQKFFAFAE
jgi:putative flippase GtrA